MALSRRKSKDLLLDGRMRPYQNSIAYQKEKGKDFFRKICIFSGFFRKEGVVGGLEHISNGTKLDGGDVLDAPFDFHQRFSGEGHAQKLNLPDKLCLSHALSRRMRRMFSPMGMVGDCLIFGSILPPCGFSFHFRKKGKEKQEKAPEKQIPLRKHCFSVLWIS